jgi:hypothetical protein
MIFDLKKLNDQSSRVTTIDFLWGVNPMNLFRCPLHPRISVALLNIIKNKI